MACHTSVTRFKPIFSADFGDFFCLWFLVKVWYFCCCYARSIRSFVFSSFIQLIRFFNAKRCYCSAMFWKILYFQRKEKHAHCSYHAHVVHLNPVFNNVLPGYRDELTVLQGEPSGTLEWPKEKKKQQHTSEPTPPSSCVTQYRHWHQYSLKVSSAKRTGLMERKVTTACAESLQFIQQMCNTPWQCSMQMLMCFRFFLVAVSIACFNWRWIPVPSRCLPISMLQLIHVFFHAC